MEKKEEAKKEEAKKEEAKKEEAKKEEAKKEEMGKEEKKDDVKKESQKLGPDMEDYIVIEPFKKEKLKDNEDPADFLKLTVEYAFNNFTVERDIASYIKEMLDSKYYKTWHCIVGTSFGSRVTFQDLDYALVAKGSVYVLVFRSG